DQRVEHLALELLQYWRGIELVDRGDDLGVLFLQLPERVLIDRREDLVERLIQRLDDLVEIDLAQELRRLGQLALEILGGQQRCDGSQHIDNRVDHAHGRVDDRRKLDPAQLDGDRLQYLIDLVHRPLDIELVQQVEQRAEDIFDL